MGHNNHHEVWKVSGKLSGGGAGVDIVTTVFSRLNAPGLYLNLALWTQHLYDTGSLCGFFILEAMVFSLLIFTDINRSVITAAYYMSNKYFRGLFKTPPWRPGIYSKPGV